MQIASHPLALIGWGGVMKGQSAYIPPPVPHTITLLMFCKNFTLALLECLCLPSPLKPLR